MLKKVDLHEELLEAKERQTTDELMVEVHDILLQEGKRDGRIREQLAAANGIRNVNEKRLDPRRVFDLELIKEVAIKYRLRFLDTKYYNNPFPREAFTAIKHLEDGLGHNLTDFKILAPSSAFKLCDANADPLLFVPVGNGRYYLVHKWGTDLNMVRRTLYWPFRTPKNLIVSLVLLSFVGSCMIPNELIAASPNAGFWGPHRMLFWVWSAAVISSITVYSWLAFFGKFSVDAWNDHRFN
jgi:hypothetical protein